MKQQQNPTSYSLWQKGLVIFSFLSLALALVLYICTAMNFATIAVLTLINAGAALLYLFPGKSTRAFRVIARVLLLLPPLLFLILTTVYLTLLTQYEYVVTLGQTFLFLTVFAESALFFSTPAWAVIGLKGRTSDLLIGAIGSLVNLIFATVTVTVLAPMVDKSGKFLLSMLFRNELYYGVFLLCTLIGTICFIVVAVGSVRAYLDKLAEEKARITQKRRRR